MRAAAAIAALVLLPAIAGAQASEPVAFFTVEPAQASVGSSVAVDASLSTGAEEYAWRWDADEAYVVGNRTEEHVYGKGGVHVIGLRIADAEGVVAFANQSVLVRGSAPSPYLQPDAYEARDGGLYLRANASYSTPSNGASRVVRYEWDWGEGEGFFEGGQSEEHFFAQPGAYRVRLRVTDDLDRNATFVYPVLVKSTFLTRMREVWHDRDSFVDGAKLTLYLAIVATVLGFVLAILLALLRISRHALLKWPALAYIEVIRGTPLFLQILIVWLVLPYFGIRLSPLNAGIVALVVNTTAYQAEAIRAGIQAIPSGQMEAAISMGMTYPQAMRHIIVPQAFRLALPALGNEFIILLKDTSLVSAIGVVELTFIGRAFANRTFLVVEPFLAVGLVYFLMTYSLSSFLRWLEKRLAIPGMGLSGVAA